MWVPSPITSGSLDIALVAARAHPAQQSPQACLPQWESTSSHLWRQPREAWHFLNGKIIMMMARFRQVSQALCIVDSTCPSVREGGTEPQWQPCFSDDGSEAAQVPIAGQHWDCRGTQVWLGYLAVFDIPWMSHPWHCWKWGVCSQSLSRRGLGTQGSLHCRMPGGPVLWNWTSVACPLLPWNGVDHMRKWLHSQRSEHNSVGLDFL